MTISDQIVTTLRSPNAQKPGPQPAYQESRQESNSL